MKKNEIALLLLIIGISFGSSFLLVRSVIGDAKAKSVDVQTVEKMISEVVEPEARTFRQGAINPTVEASIGAPSNKQPLGN